MRIKIGSLIDVRKMFLLRCKKKEKINNKIISSKTILLNNIDKGKIINKKSMNFELILFLIKFMVFFIPFYKFPYSFI